MKRLQEQRFRRILEGKRADLLQRITALQERLQVDGGGDPAEQAQRLLDQQVVLDTVERMSATLCGVEDALREIKQGTFGRCAACDQPIPSKRLQIVPWSPYCISCQERSERAGASGEAAAWSREYVSAGSGAASLSMG